MRKYIYFGTDFFFSSVERLANHGYTPCAVYTTNAEKSQHNGNETCIRYAQDNGIPVHFDHPNEEQLNMLANSTNAEFYMIAAYPHKLPSADTLNIPGFNIHPSLLPVGRGPFPFPHAILKKLKRFGISYHKISNTFDRGDILMQRVFTLDSDESLDSIIFKCRQAVDNSIVDVVTRINPLFENASLQGTGEYWPELGVKDRWIKKEATVDEINLIFRAFGKNGVFFSMKGSVFCATQGRAWSSDISLFDTNDGVIHSSSTELYLEAKDGVIGISSYFKIKSA